MRNEIFFVLEQIDEGQKYDPRDVRRFNEVDEYTTMFIQHGQFGTSFDEDRGLRIFNLAMSWRKENNVYGTDFIRLSNRSSLSLDVSPNDFPANYFDRNAVYLKNHDIHNNQLSKSST